MSLSAHLQYTGINAGQVLEELSAEQVVALQRIKPALEQILVTTIGTRYYSLSQLRLMHHPYSYGGNPPLPLGIINMQSERFYRATKIIGPTRIGNRVIMQIFNADEGRAEQLAGTSRMPPRPYKLMLQSRLRRVLDKELQGALSGLVKLKVAA